MSPHFLLAIEDFYCRRVTALHTVPDFTVCAMSSHLHLSALCLEVFRRPGVGFHVLFSQKWLLSWTAGCSSPGTETVAWCKPCVLEPGPCALCGWQQGALGARAVQPGELVTLLLNSSGLSGWGFFVISMDLKEQWLAASPSPSRVGLGFKISWRQRVLPYQGWECTKELWKKSWIKELKCMRWGIFLSAHETNASLQVMIINEKYIR